MKNFDLFALRHTTGGSGSRNLDSKSGRGCRFRRRVRRVRLASAQYYWESGFSGAWSHSAQKEKERYSSTDSSNSLFSFRLVVRAVSAGGLFCAYFHAWQGCECEGYHQGLFPSVVSHGVVSLSSSVFQAALPAV